VNLNRLIICSALLMPIVSCSFLRETIGLGPAAPKVKVQSVKFEKVSLETLSIKAKIRVDNPNGFDMDFSSLKYDMVIRGKILASGVYQKKFTIPAKAMVFLELPLDIDTQHAIWIIKKIIGNSETLTAKIRATAKFVTPVGDISVDFEDEKIVR